MKKKVIEHLEKCDCCGGKNFTVTLQEIFKAHLSPEGLNCKNNLSWEWIEISCNKCGKLFKEEDFKDINI